MGWEILPEIRNGLTAPLKGPERLGWSSRWFGTGRGTLPDVRDESGSASEGPG